MGRELQEVQMFAKVQKHEQSIYWTSNMRNKIDPIPMRSWVTNSSTFKIHMYNPNG